MKRKVQEWGVKKCIPLVGAKIAPTCAGRQTTPSHVSQYRVENGNLRKSECSFRHGTAFATKECLHQKEARSMESIPLVGANSVLTCAYRQTTQSHVSQYRAENRNLRKSGSTFHHGTVFAPKQRLYEKIATGMESSKMHFSSRCKNRTYLCGTETTRAHVSLYMFENKNLRKSESTCRHGTVFAPKECFYQKEPTGMESTKMHSSSRGKNCSCQCVSANYSVSCKAV